MTHPIGWDVEKSGGFGGCATPTAHTHDDRKVVSIKGLRVIRGGSLWLALPASLPLATETETESSDIAR